MQVVAFMTQFPFTTSKTGESLLRRAMSLGADVVGGVYNVDPDPEKYLDIIFNVAKDFDADIDLHIDESNDPKDLTLGIYAEKALENGYEGRVTAGHCCSLSAVSDEIAKSVIGKVRDAKMNVVANPFDNLYLWGEDGRPEGVTRVGELLDAGVNVIYATDSTEDIFCPLANADMLLAALFLAYLKQLDGKDALTTIFKMGTSSAAKATRIIPNYGIKEGGRADLMILDAESPREAIIKQAKRLYVIKNGKIVVKNGFFSS
jgi:cytosine deaminase